MAVSSISHRRKIRTRFCEFIEAIDNLVEDSNTFMSQLPSDLTIGIANINEEPDYKSFNTEELAERIDQDIHKLHYLLDNCRR